MSSLVQEIYKQHSVFIGAYAWERFLKYGKGIVNFYIGGGESQEYDISYSTEDDFLDVALEKVLPSDKGVQAFTTLMKHLKTEEQFILVCWDWNTKKHLGVDLIKSPVLLSELQSELTKRTQTKIRQQKEKELEDGLYDWLRIQGVDIDRQVKTGKHRLDLWIPGRMMLELKAGKVGGDDVCQAIDYYSTYRKTIVLVGSGMSDSATRGINGFNTAIGADGILFMTWGAIKSYLRAELQLDK